MKLHLQFGFVILTTILSGCSDATTTDKAVEWSVSQTKVIKLDPFYPLNSDVYSLGPESPDIVDSSNVRLLTNLDQQEIMDVNVTLNGALLPAMKWQLYAQGGASNMISLPLMVSGGEFIDGVNQLIFKIVATDFSESAELTISVTKDTNRPRAEVIKVADQQLRVIATDDELGGIDKVVAHFRLDESTIEKMELVQQSTAEFDLRFSAQLTSDQLLYLSVYDIHKNEAIVSIDDLLSTTLAGDKLRLNHSWPAAADALRIAKSTEKSNRSAALELQNSSTGGSQNLSAGGGIAGACANEPLKYEIVVPYIYDPNDLEGKREIEDHARDLHRHNVQYFIEAIDFYNDQLGGLGGSGFGGIGYPSVVTTEDSLKPYRLDDSTVVGKALDVVRSLQDSNRIIGTKVANLGELALLFPHKKDIITIIAVDLISVQKLPERFGEPDEYACVAGATSPPTGLLIVGDPASVALTQYNGCDRDSENYSTLAHELGHLFGLDHYFDAPDACDNLMSYCRGYDFIIKDFQKVPVNGHLCGSAEIRYNGPGQSGDRFINIFDMPGDHTCGNGRIGHNERGEEEQCEASIRMTPAYKGSAATNFTAADRQCPVQEPSPDVLWPSDRLTCTKTCLCTPPVKVATANGTGAGGDVGIRRPVGPNTPNDDDGTIGTDECYQVTGEGGFLGDHKTRNAPQCSGTCAMVFVDGIEIQRQCRWVDSTKECKCEAAI